MRYPRSTPGMCPSGGSHSNAIEVEVVLDAVTFAGGLGGAKWQDIGRLDHVQLSCTSCRGENVNSNGGNGQEVGKTSKNETNRQRFLLEGL